MGALYHAGSRLLVTGGGTGGHVIPAIEIARAHRERANAPVFYAGGDGSLEARLAERARIPFFPVSSGGFVGKSLSGKLAGLRKMAGGIPSAIKVLTESHPDLVIGTGGYVQVPVVLAARIRGIPVVLLEPNRVPGLANRLLRPLAVRTVVAGEQGQKGGGIPVAPGVRGPAPLPERFFRNPPKILVMGGSQGARAINRKIPEIIGELRNTSVGPIEILHQSGERWLEETRESYRNLGLSARVEGFLPGISGLLSAQTLVIARAGAMTIAELTGSGTPAIYIPFPHSAGGHQEMNALSLAKEGGGWFWREDRLEDPAACAKDLARILMGREELFATARNAWRLSPAVPAEEWLQALETTIV